MTENIHFSIDEIDALKEVINLGMGQAGAALSEILDGFVTLSVPEIKLVKSNELPDVLNKFIEKEEFINVLTQSFVDDIWGEIIYIYAPINYHHLGKILGFAETGYVSEQTKSELLFEISNSLGTACLMGLGSEIGINTELKPPRVVCLEKSPKDVKTNIFGNKKPSWNQSLLINIEFLLSDIKFFCEIIVFVSQDSILPLKNAIVELLEG